MTSALTIGLPLLGALLLVAVPRLGAARVVAAVVLAEVGLAVLGAPAGPGFLGAPYLDGAERIILAVGALGALATLSAIANDPPARRAVATGLVCLAGLAVVVTAGADLIGAATATTAIAILVSWGPARASGPGTVHRSVQRYLVWMLLGGSALLFSGSFQGVYEERAVTGVLAPAAALFVVGIGIFVAALPFSLWLPSLCDDTPEGAGLAVGLLSCAMMAVLDATAPASPFLARDVALRGVLGTGGGIAAVVGSCLALGEKRPGRALAYLIGAGADYSLAGLASNSSDALVPAIWLLGAQALAAALTFGALANLGRAGQARGVGVASLTGLVWRRPVLGWSMVVGLLSLVGMPATAGFVGRWETIEVAGWHVGGLALGMLVASVLSGLAVLRQFGIVFDATDQPREPLRFVDAAVAVVAIALVVAGAYPWPIIELLR